MSKSARPAAKGGLGLRFSHRCIEPLELGGTLNSTEGLFQPVSPAQSLFPGAAREQLTALGSRHFRRAKPVHGAADGHGVLRPGSAMPILVK